MRNIPSKVLYLHSCDGSLLFKKTTHDLEVLQILTKQGVQFYAK